MAELFEFDSTQGDEENDIFDTLSSDLVLFMFSATWCRPCVALTPIVKKMAAETPAVKFYKIDVEQFQAVAEYFNVAAMPTFIFLYKGKIAHMMQGGSEAKLRSGVEILQKMQQENVAV